LSSPDDLSVGPEPVSIPFREKIRRLDALRRSMPTGVTADLNDETLLAIRAGLERVERGTR
jgi:hypothetical protein